jgi:gliding motility-associated-like protein
MNRISQQLIVLVLLVWMGAISSNVSAQILISQEGTVTACGELFYDDDFTQDDNGNPYSDNDYTITICPETPGDAIQVVFLGFNLQTNPNPNNNDVLYVFDGDDTSAEMVGAGTGNSLQGVSFTASTFNPTGCLTFVFNSNNGATAGATGWVGEIACVTPCTYPESGYELTNPAPFEAGVPSVGVCPNQELSFDGGLSEADASPLEYWIWNWGDGSIDSTTTPLTTHSYEEPGEYLVTLVVADENECTSVNLDVYQVLVSTIPIFNADFSTPLCVGSPGFLDGSPVQSITWTALPPLAVSESEPLPDATGVWFTSELFIDFFDDGQVLEDCADLIAVNALMEHSFVGDLTITVACPDGTEVMIMDNNNAGSDDCSQGNDLNGYYLGEPDDFDGATPNPGVGYWYSFTENGEYVLDDADNPNVTGNTIPAGEYGLCGEICDFVGCPLNGIWTFNVIDQWGADNGFLFEWGIDFNPEIVPGVTTFTPTIGADADSSFWNLDLNTYGVSSLDAEADYVDLLFDAPGTYPFTYTVTNNFSCSWDTIVNIEVVPGLGNSASAGMDQIFCQTPVQLQGSVNTGAASGCINSEGTSTLCYGDGAMNETYTYCPDNPGDGTMMVLSVLEGEVQENWDNLTIYDGDDITAPVLEGPISGDLSGMFWTATNPDGCLTLSFNSDWWSSCATGMVDPIVLCTSCGGDTECAFNWTWSPADYLDDPNIPNPTVLDFDGVPTEYTLLVEPIQLENCGTETTVMVEPGFQFTYEVDQPSCLITDGEILVNITSPAADGPWNITLSEGGSLAASDNSNGGLTLFENLSPGDYVLEVADGAGCAYEFEITLEDPPALTLEVSNDSTICIDGVATLEVWSDMDSDANWTYSWDSGLGTGMTKFVSPVTTTTYEVQATDEDNCPSETETITVFVHDSLSIASIVGETLICGGSAAQLEVDGATGGSGNGYSYDWTWMNIPVGDDDPELVHYPSSTGTYCVTLSDNCETPEITECVEVVIETPIPPTYSVDTARACVPGVVQFTLENDSDQLQSQFWFFGDGEGSMDQDPAHAYMEPGIYDLTLEIVSNLGCTYTAQFEGAIEIFTPPMVGFTASPQPATAPDTEIEFEAVNSSNVVEWYWQFDTVADLGASMMEDPVFTFPIDRGGLYPVTLVVTDENGCSSQVTRYVEIFDLYNLFIPTSFTPNNDGVNDAFGIKGTDIDPNRFVLQVFNRWGEQVFETKDPEGVWHGPATQDSEYYVQDNIYMYRVVVYSLSLSGNRREITGYVTVLR